MTHTQSSSQGSVLPQQWRLVTKTWLPDSVLDAVEQQLGVSLIRTAAGDPLCWGVCSWRPVTDRQLALVELMLSEWIMDDCT
jgi:hypothetical protein